jgi:peptide/nickel transport system permease protein
MAKYVARRVALAFVVIIGVLVITFVISHVIPNDPARLYAGGERATVAEVQQARHELGTDKPLPEQFVIYVGNIIHGDLGISITSHRPVTEDIGVFLTASLELVIPAIALALLIGVPIGVLTGASSGRGRRIGNLIAITGAAVPPFWLALLGQLVFAVFLGWLPVAGRVGTDTTIFNPVRPTTGFNLIDSVISGNWSGFVDSLDHMLMPVLVLFVYPVSLVIRQTSASVSQVMTAPYVAMARSTGLPQRTILFRNVLKNAVGPTLTVLGLTFAGALTGIVLVETIFSWPGIGTYLTTAILNSDYPVIIAVTLIGAMGYVVVNLIVDLLQAALDPRVRLG